MRLLSSTRIVRVTLALAVAFWMAGGGCMLGCENMVAEAAANEAMSPANSAAIVVSGDACASMHSHDCCSRHGVKPAAHSASKPAAPSKSATNSRTAALPFVNGVVAGLAAPLSTMMDCPLAVNATAALSKGRPDQSSSALPLTRANNTLPHFQEHTATLSPPLVLPNRGHTYLRCCVFLI